MRLFRIYFYAVVSADFVAGSLAAKGPRRQAYSAGVIVPAEQGQRSSFAKKLTDDAILLSISEKHP
jgi:hypothetical protein